VQLRGEYALLSDRFFYFGDQAIALPHYLLSNVKQGQGHRAGAIAPCFDRFISWLDGLDYPPNSLVGNPQQDLFKNEAQEECAAGCRESVDAEDEDSEEEIIE
jgi:hypothetical protein